MTIWKPALLALACATALLIAVAVVAHLPGVGGATILSAAGSASGADALAGQPTDSSDRTAPAPAAPAPPPVAAPYSEVLLSATSVYQGGALQVRVTHARSGSAVLSGRSFTLTPEGEDIVGYVAIGAENQPGTARLSFLFVNASGAQELRDRLPTIVKTDWTTDYIVIPPSPPSRPNASALPPDETRPLAALYAGVSPRAWRDGWVAPLEGSRRITGYFGERRSYNGGPLDGRHGGTDFAASWGTPIFATNDGVVAMAQLTLIRGNLVVIDHGGGVFSAYAHMSYFGVGYGERVTRGQHIGWVGSTGLATGPHLHWEISVGGVLVDGLRWLDGSQGF